MGADPIDAIPHPSSPLQVTFQIVAAEVQPRRGVPCRHRRLTGRWVVYPQPIVLIAGDHDTTGIEENGGRGSAHAGVPIPGGHFLLG